MGKIDKEKEYIGVVVIWGAIILFAYVVKILHTHIDKLEEL